jgi:NAD(P)-dependent dehydrogenase (short-subunit alcohol dehydrogenase family)
MTTAASTAVCGREPELPGQTVVIIGGGADIGLVAARRAAAEVGAGRGRGPGLSFIAAATAAMPALIANLVLEIAPVRVNLIAPGFVDTPLSASLVGDDLEARRAQLRARLPIGRVVGPADVAASPSTS